MSNMKARIKSCFDRLGYEVTRKNRCSWIRNLNIRTVIDIGANEGQFAHKIHEVLPEAYIYSFEPLRKCYERLKGNFEGVARFHAFNLALGDTDAQGAMNQSNTTGSSSILKMNDLHKQAFPKSGEGHTEEIVIKQLDKIAPQIELNPNILIKIDVQGYEDKVVAGGSETIRKAKIVIVETSFCEMYEGQPLFDDMYCKLKDLGFKYMGAFEQIRNPLDDSFLQADSIFIK